MSATATRQHQTITANPTTAHKPTGVPRFAGDWVDAWLRLCPDSARVHLSTTELDWILPALDIDALATALDGATGTTVQFNPDAALVLVPGAHTRLGSSFFRLGL